MDPQVQNEGKPVMFRLFIALAVPDRVKDEIRRAQEQLRQALPERCASWTRPEQWHLTLKFLGNVDAARVGALTEALRAAGEEFAPLKLRAERMGCFPDLRFPRVVWIGVSDAENRLAHLAKAVEDAVERFTAEKREGKFTAHITIARIKNIKRPEVEILARHAHGMADHLFGEWTADAVDVMRSELAIGGAKHTCLARLPLKQIT